MRYLVALHNPSRGGSVATIVVELPDKYDFSQDYKLESCTGHFKSLKKLCQEQCPSGFHPVSWMLSASEIETTQVIAVSKLFTCGCH